MFKYFIFMFQEIELMFELSINQVNENTSIIKIEKNS
jgi:hypothetical protein